MKYAQGLGNLLEYPPHKLQTLDRLDASAAGDDTSKKSLVQLVRQLPHALIRAPPIRPRRQAPSEPPKERLACLPPERAVLNVRPFAKTSGPRHVPILASANGVPFLRLTKPQPPALSRMLRQRLQRKIDLFDSKVLLGNWWLPVCRQEDDWDDLLKGQLGNDEDSVKWTDAVRQAETENHWAYERDLRKDRDMMRDMQAIVDKEMELALKEGQTIIRGRKRRPILVIRPKP